MENYKLFTVLNEGSHFHVSHFILQKESVFFYKALVDSDLLLLNYDDYMKLSQRSEIL